MPINDIPFFSFAVFFILLMTYVHSDKLICSFFYKSELDFNTRRKKPNQKHLKQYTELFKASLSKEEKDQAIITMENIIRAKKEHKPDDDYAYYDRSLVRQFKCKVTFAYVQCAFDVFEESGFDGNVSELATKTRFSIPLK